MTNTPKPQANTLDEIRGKLHLLYNGMTSNSKDADLILKTPVSDIVLQVEEQIQALITEAMVEQIMQDELSLMDTELPEEEIIQWRLARLTQLKENK